ncbi:hypothetical protein [Brucella thiophenivorans]|uniref:Uncharacterized protein n=1 Tax=Brucella thiophenivorans TaxID=571255 RepID=A0A256F395_9HYPH|nr:hypothetical protein [Brucella thiophenivorans]OYR09253.1 hypothetical protein CEV31_3886 [Brucella thiophenivorans]
MVTNNIAALRQELIIEVMMRAITASDVSVRSDNKTTPFLREWL